MRRISTDPATLRPYGPGKFSLMVDAYVYSLSLNGCDEETGSVQEGWWYGLLKGFDRADIAGTAVCDGDINEAEVAFLLSQAGAILSEDDQGFVSVDYYDTADELSTAWAEVCKADDDSE